MFYNKQKPTNDTVREFQSKSKSKKKKWVRIEAKMKEINYWKISL